MRKTTGVASETEDEIVLKSHVEKPKRFWWHWQNLKDDEPGRHWLHGRAWWNWCRHRLRVEWIVRRAGVGAAVVVDQHGDDTVEVSLRLSLVGIYVGINPRWSWLPEDATEVLDVSLYDWTLRWSVWHPRWSWTRGTPRWRNGHLDLRDALLGEAEHAHRELLVTKTSVAFPEGVYPVTITFYEQRWKRPRWKAVVQRGATVAVEGGVPVPGKGENAWDCGEDAIWSASSPSTTHDAALLAFVMAVYEKRYRYGGSTWAPAPRRHGQEAEAIDRSGA